MTQAYGQTDYSSSCGGYSTWFAYTAYEYANGEVLNERTNGNVPVWYVRDPYGNLLYTLHWRGNQLQPDVYVRDRLGSIRIVLDYQGNVANTYHYDAYGEITASSATLRNSYTFTAYQADQSIGLYYAKARYYNPAIGRFLTQDAWLGNPWMPGTLNPYAYVANNPVNFIDPTGHALEPGTGTAGDQEWIETALRWLSEQLSGERLAEAVGNFFGSIGKPVFESAGSRPHVHLGQG